MSYCPYIKRGQQQCGIKLRSGRTYCYKHSKCINLPETSISDIPPKEKPVNKEKEPNRAKAKALDAIISESLASSFNQPDESSEEELDGLPESYPIKSTPEPIKKAKPIEKKPIEKPIEEKPKINYSREPVKQINLSTLKDSQLIDRMTDMLQSGDPQSREALEIARKRNIINSTQFNQLIKMYL